MNVLTPEEIKDIRLKLQLTQAQMATFMGLGGDRRIREWETGEKSPNGTACVVLHYCKKTKLADNFIQARLKQAVKL